MVFPGGRKDQTRQVRPTGRKWPDTSEVVAPACHGRPPSHHFALDKNTIIDIVPYDSVTPGIATHAGHWLTIPQKRQNLNFSRLGECSMPEVNGPARRRDFVLDGEVSVSMLELGAATNA